MAAAGFEEVVCEADAGSVIRPLDASLQPSEVCGHTAGLIWLTTATSPLPLPGWDDSEEKDGRGPSPDVACLSVWQECGVHT